MLATALTYSEAVRTRYAPTPSGYLHRGNAAHLMLVASVAAQSGADIWLRIDDADAARYRQEYLQDIFDVLNWLNLSWDVGPRSVADVDDWTQGSRLSHYLRARDFLVGDGLAYACECSRSDWQDYEASECPRGCRARGLIGAPGETAWRVHMAQYPDPVVWRRENVPAYHLTSVVDDDLFGVDLVVRGEDLRASTMIQRELSGLLPGSTFHTARVVHHPLIVEANGMKLSKSAGSQSQPLGRTSGLRAELQALAEQLAAGITPALPRNFGS